MSHPRLRRVLEGPGGPGERSDREARHLLESGDLRRTRGVGGQGAHGV